MGLKDDLDEEFREYERIMLAEQARLYRQLTDQERLDRWIAFCDSSRSAFPPTDERTRRVAREMRDREKDAAVARMLKALG